MESKESIYRQTEYHPLKIAVFLLFLLALLACQEEKEIVPRGEMDISGVVTGANGPEAGVWVIAETQDLPTRYAKIVVTDDAGRYLIPELPDATFDVWVRGYGLVDSPKEKARPGQSLNLNATEAPSPEEAAQYYPAGYWFSLLEVPDKSHFPGTGPEGNGIAPSITNQAQYLRNIKNGNCLACHQLGSKGTREFHPSLREIESSEAAWERRLQSGQAGGSMTSSLHQLGKEGFLKMFADWTDRIEEGEIPEMPKRPEGLERNVVITQWDWADPKAYLHDLVSTDRRNPRVNANGLIYGALEASADYLPVLDPVNHTTSRVPLTVRDPNTPVASGPEMPAASPYWGEEAIWNSKANVHNPMLDEEGRVWITAAVRPFDNPEAFKEGSDHPSAKVFPLNRASRHLGVYDPDTETYKHISTGYSTHHLMFAEDENNTLWTSGGGQVVGWLDTKQYLETGDEIASQGWTPLILDTNGNGKRDAYVEPNEAINPEKDKRITNGLYAVAPAVDGSVWGSSLGYPGAVVRIVPGDNPSETALTEYYELPLDEAGEPIEGWSPRGMDIDRNGVAWVALASGHMASFDRSKCNGPLNGPDATGQHCPEGWTFYPEPLPQMKGVDYPGSAESSYYTWVDQFNTLGLGENIPINTGNESEGLLVLKDGEWVVLRVPYPMGFYTKWMDGRIDDPDTGWKGRGIWATISTRTPFHMEGGKGTTSKVYHFQMRPDPLAY
ncbi:carboxypeptidase-like regulatory domain-containing protein [Cyclobacterium sp.]|uniref:carboxypeptidase-like regulatory domain-containing protein n=1 Tax=Cyclobacterium sp. TaxID=1966343 RepID=UPI00199CE824|nr:carboxypeptidase-like regulatory domain-containing protein [Cyclobacterium sp.]MBD3629318.1 carboxypeptidase regulatory-like domain-containing protein [Cyclobacterium sp.]